MKTQDLLNQFRQQVSGSKELVRISEKQASWLVSLAKKEGLYLAKHPAAFGLPVIVDTEAGCVWTLKPITKQVANRLRGSHSQATGRFELYLHHITEGKSGVEFKPSNCLEFAGKILNISAL